MTVGASCATNFSVNLPASVLAGYYVTATATDPANNTSEFSAGIPVRPLPTLRSAVAATNQNQPTISWTWTNTGAGLVLKESDSIARPLAQWWTASNGVVFQLNPTNWLYKPALTNDHRFYKLTLP